MLEETFNQFINNRIDPERPFLIALSGGPDSLAILHIVNKYAGKMGWKCGIAHLDHNWRRESGAEAATLETCVQKMGFPFHKDVLQPIDLDGNLEDACRKERLSFFARLCQCHGYQAVILGHHADDQSETILKRVLEGSSLSFLSGMQETALIQGVNLWRPFLKIKKREILEWLKKNGIKPFDDPTNRDTTFLRARMRKNIIPELSSMFGKEIRNPLLKIGEEASALQKFLDSFVDAHIKEAVSGKMGTYLDLSHFPPEYLYALRYLVKKLSARHHLSLAKEQVEGAARFLAAKALNRRVEASGKVLIIDRGVLFLPLPETFQPINITPILKGKMQLGQWQVELSEGYMEKETVRDWKYLWEGGKHAVCLPHGEYFIANPHLLDSCPEEKQKLGKRFGGAKIPGFLRGSIPVLTDKKTVVHEFLTGKKKKLQSEIQEGFLVSLQFLDYR